jgi:hypothetical protein
MKMFVLFLNRECIHVSKNHTSVSAVLRDSAGTGDPDGSFAPDDDVRFSDA